MLLPAAPPPAPGWKIVLAPGGGAEVGYVGDRTAAATGVVVPPQPAHTCTVSPAYVVLFLDPWERALGTGPAALDETAPRRVLAALGRPGPGADLDAARAELRRLAGGSAPLDPRVAHAVRQVTRAGSTPRVGAVAVRVGLSPSRLRMPVRDGVEVPLPRLPLWAVLHAAMAEPPAESAACAAAFAGFADQAHLTRTARTHAGRTPSGILRPKASAGSPRARAMRESDLEGSPSRPTEHRTQPRWSALRRRWSSSMASRRSRSSVRPRSS